MVTLAYFAWVREKIGVSGESVEPPTEVRTVSDLIDWLAGSSAAHADAFADRNRLRAAIDQKFVPLDASIAGAKEIALFPPVTGG